MRDIRAKKDVYSRQETQSFGPRWCMIYKNSLKDVSSAKNMGSHNQSLEPLKNFHHFHGTHWQQISSTGRKWTFS